MRRLPLARFGLAALLVASAPAEAAFPQAAAQAPVRAEVLNEVRVHGNYATPDAEVVRIAGLVVGQPLPALATEEAKSRLERSGRFVSVDVRRRYRSLDDATDVAVVIVVQEHPVPEDTPRPLRPMRRTLGGTMFLPIVQYTDGYGLTYGARVSFVDGLGRGARVSVPLTWGGTKRAAAEFEKVIERGPVDRVFGSVVVSRRTNPFYRQDDTRKGGSAGVSRQLAGSLRLAAHAGVATVGFADVDERMRFFGLDLTLDTRTDPVFPRNAVLVTAGWQRSAFRLAAPVNTASLDARGYVGVVGQSVLSVRALLVHADGALPPFERQLLGGAATLRGYRAGSFSGDSLAAASVELRIPTSSPLSFARAGVSLFADTGTAFDYGTRLRDATWHHGFGGGVFLHASVFQLNADVAFRPGRGHPRLHVVSGFLF